MRGNHRPKLRGVRAQPTAWRAGAVATVAATALAVALGPAAVRAWDAPPASTTSQSSAPSAPAHPLRTDAQADASDAAPVVEPAAVAADVALAQPPVDAPIAPDTPKVSAGTTASDVPAEVASERATVAPSQGALSPATATTATSPAPNSSTATPAEGIAAPVVPPQAQQPRPAAEQQPTGKSDDRTPPTGGQAEPVVPSAASHATTLPVTPSPITAAWLAAGGASGWLGAPLSDESSGPVDGSTVRHFAHGSLFWSPDSGVHSLRGAIRAHWFALSPTVQRQLGALTTDEIDFAGGRASRFTSGALFWTARSGVDFIAVPDPARPDETISGAHYGDAEVLVERGQGWLPQFLRPINFSGDGGPATSARIAQATTIAADGSGGYYFADSRNQRIRHVAADGIIRTVVGNGQDPKTTGPQCAWGKPALQTCLNWVHGVSLDTDGGLIITDSFNHVVTKLGRDGIVRRLAGTGTRCLPATASCGEGGSALNAALDRPTTSRRIGDTLYISDSSDRILAVGPDGIMRRVVGTGQAGFSGDEGPATAARIWGPADMIGYRGGLLISDGNNCRLRWVDPQGIIHAFAGYGGDIQWCWRNYGDVKYGPTESRNDWGRDGPMTGNVGDYGPALWSRLSVTGFLADVGGEVCVTDFLNYRVRCIDGRGLIRTVVGGVYGNNGSSPLNAVGVDGPLPAQRFPMGWAGGIAYDPVRQRLLVSDGRIIGVDIPVWWVTAG